MVHLPVTANYTIEGDDMRGIRPFGRSHEHRQWSHWDHVADTRSKPDATESDPDSIEAMIADTANRFARQPIRNNRGQWATGGRSQPDRDVKMYLTHAAYSLTLAEVGQRFGMTHRTSIRLALRRGGRLVATAREMQPPTAPPTRPKEGPRW